MLSLLCHSDVMLSLMSDYQVTLVNNQMNEFFVKFFGPKESRSMISRTLAGNSLRIMREDSNKAAEIWRGLS